VRAWQGLAAASTEGPRPGECCCTAVCRPSLANKQGRQGPALLRHRRRRRCPLLACQPPAASSASCPCQSFCCASQVYLCLASPGQPPQLPSGDPALHGWTDLQDGEAPLTVVAGGAKKGGKSGSSRSSGSSGGMELDDEWVVEHAAMVERLLPGGACPAPP